MTEGLIIAMLAALAIAVIAYMLQSLPLIFMSSVGWSVAALQVFQQTEEILPMALLFMLAFGQFFIVRRNAA